MSPTVSDLLRDHVTLSIASIDRLYVNGYAPKLQTGGQLHYFLHDHLGNPIPSPALFGAMRTRFVQSIHDFAQAHSVPLVQFERGQRKDDIANARRAAFTAPEGVVFIGVAQERAMSFKATKRAGPGKRVWFDFSRQSVAVNHYYFYVQDLEWGPAFLKVCSYLPYPVKICLNGHEWAKQQLGREDIGYSALDNGFLDCDDPRRLQAICDDLGPDDVQAFFDRWSQRLPWPLTKDDRAAGFGHRLSIWQLEASLTQVFDRPVQGRHFFEDVIRDNLDLGRPDRVRLIFPIRLNRRTPPPRFGYRTRVITDGVNPSLHVDFKRSSVKQYFKEERALRTETTINDPQDFWVRKDIKNLWRLRDIGQQVNNRLLQTERLSENCVLSQGDLDHLQMPTVEAGQRVPAMRFGDLRVMALLHALCLFLHLPTGFRNADLRRHVAALLGLDLDTYTRGRMTYDLRRLRLKGLIERRPGTNVYQVTPHGLRVAYFYAKVHLRIMRPGWAAISRTADPIPRRLRQAFARVDAEIDRLCDAASLGVAA